MIFTRRYDELNEDKKDLEQEQQELGERIDELELEKETPKIKKELSRIHSRWEAIIEEIAVIEEEMQEEVV